MIERARGTPDARAKLEPLAKLTLTRAQRAKLDEALAHTYAGAEKRAKLLAVAETYKDLPIAEAAFVAALRIPGPDEKALMKKYLERYPEGIAAKAYRAKL
jgi:hypothetical protein